MRLQGTRALITGAADGLGLAIARAFAAQGARLFLLDVDRAALERVKRELRDRTVEAHAYVGSVADSRDVEDAFACMDAELGGIDALINNAGISANRATLEISDDEWDRAIGVNLRGPFLCARAAGRRMIAQRSGSIVGIASIFGVVAAPDRLPYCVSKAGMVMMAKSLAVEWGAHGVRCNAIAPGYMRTKLTDDLVARGRIDIAALERRTPIGRLPRPEEVAEMAVYLCSDAAACVTGQVIAVDGGWTAYGYV